MCEPSRVMIIDDDDAIRDLIELALTDEGFVVQSAANGAEALQLLEHEQPEVILLDTRMPVMDGPAFVEAYRQRPKPHAPIVVLTAASEAAELMQQMTPDAYLAKPFDLHALIDIVKRFDESQ